MSEQDIENKRLTGPRKVFGALLLVVDTLPWWNFLLGICSLLASLYFLEGSFVALDAANVPGWSFALGAIAAYTSVILCVGVPFGAAWALCHFVDFSSLVKTSSSSAEPNKGKRSAE